MLSAGLHSKGPTLPAETALGQEQLYPCAYRPEAYWPYNTHQSTDNISLPGEGVI